MQAAVLPDVDVAVVRPPDREFAAEKLAMEDMALRLVVGRGDRMPLTFRAFKQHPLHQFAAGITP
jgi:hypothetical protein